MNAHTPPNTNHLESPTPRLPQPSLASYTTSSVSSDPEISHPYWKLPGMEESVAGLKDIVEQLSKKSEKELASIARGDQFYRMVAACSREIDTASGADAAVHTVVRGGFLAARRDMLERRQCSSGTSRPWWGIGERGSRLRNVPSTQDTTSRRSKRTSNVTHGQKPDPLIAYAKEAAHIGHEQKHETSDPLIKKASRIADKQRQSIENRLPTETPHLTHEKRKCILKQIMALSEMHFKIALMTLREKCPKSYTGIQDMLDRALIGIPDKVFDWLCRSILIDAQEARKHSRRRSADASSHVARAAPKPIFLRSKSV